MIIDGHEETTGEEIDWACDTRDEIDPDNIIFRGNKWGRFK